MDSSTEFEQYLAEKKINSTVFRQAEPELWQELANIFQQVHPNSFTAQKLFLINKIRRKYILIEEIATPKAKEVNAKQPVVPKASKPKVGGAVKPKIKVPVRKPKQGN